jgi:16S rRNA (cytosine1402-N4)-methyltransferase
MLPEAIAGLDIKPDGVYIDGTFGRGGHAAAILNRLSEHGRLLVLDKDPEAIAEAQKRYGQDPRLIAVQTSFAEVYSVASQHGLIGKVNGLLLDLGVSSPQLDDPTRGFSFKSEGPLDMRMNPNAGKSAAQWLASATAQEISRVLKEYGEERYSGRIARAIVDTRDDEPILTTKSLASLIARVVPSREKHKDPATRTFQALRIFINQELEDIQRCLKDVLEVLAPSGRLVVISFHSLEDRLVKRFIRDQARGEVLPSKLPITASMAKVFMKKIGKAQMPSDEEVRINPRARSAVLRVAEKI